MSQPRRIRRRAKAKLFWAQKGYGTFIDVLNQFTPSCPSNIGENSCQVDTSLALSAVSSYWTFHAQFFSPINFNKKHKFCAKSSFSLLLILIGHKWVLLVRSMVLKWFEIENDWINTVLILIICAKIVFIRHLLEISKSCVSTECDEVGEADTRQQSTTQIWATSECTEIVS